MKLYFMFALIDLFTVLAYPFVFISGKVRQLLKIKR
jgi:hypothetical protein